MLFGSIMKLDRAFKRIFASLLLMSAMCVNLYASSGDSDSQGSMMRMKHPDVNKKVKEQKFDRAMFGFYAFGGMSFSTFVGQEVYNWCKDIGYVPGYTVGGGFDILRRPDGIYFGTEVAFTMKGVAKRYEAKPLYGEEGAKSRVILNYWQVTPLKVGGRIKLNEDMGISIYSGFGIDLLMVGRERYNKEAKENGYKNELMRRHTDWDGRVDMFVPFNINFDYKQWSYGISYDLGINDLIEGQGNQDINRVHNSTIAIKAIYHFRFKDKADKVVRTKEKKVVDKYHRDEF